MRTFKVTAILRDPDEAHLRFEGQLGPAQARRVRVLLDALLAAGARRIVVDFATTEHRDTDLLDYLHHLARWLSAGEGWMLLDGAPSTLRLEQQDDNQQDGDEQDGDEQDGERCADPGGDPTGMTLEQLFVLYRDLLRPDPITGRSEIPRVE